MARSVVIDANLLVLLVAGNTDRNLIERHKNVTYDEDGFDLLVETLEGYSQIVLTPNTLTEASNLLRQIGDPDCTRITFSLGEFIQGHDERYVVSKEATVENTFGRLGLTDAALMVLARTGAVLLSSDNDLYLAASRAGFEVVNFAHLYDARFG
jgi:hypothetical protein